AAETLMGKFRDGMPVTGEAVTVILSTIDRIKEILDELEAKQQEPEGQDRDLISQLERMVIDGPAAAKPAAAAPAAPAAPTEAVGTLVDQVWERPLRVGEVPLDELERAFRETAAEIPPVEAQAKPAPAAPAAAKTSPAKSAPAKGAREQTRVEKDE